MTSRERHETIRVRHDGTRVYTIGVQRQRWDADLKQQVSMAPEVWIYPPDDGHYSIEFTSRSGLNWFVKQLESIADEVWPT